MNSPNNGFESIKRRILLFIGVCAAIVFVVSLYIPTRSSEFDELDWWGGFFQNFSTELIGAAITFLLIEIILGRIREEESANEMKELKQQSIQTYVQLDVLGKSLNTMLEQAGIKGIEDFVPGASFHSLSVGEQKDISATVGVMQDLLSTLDEPSRDQGVRSESLIAMARALMAQNNWAQAVMFLDEYVREFPEHWEVHFLRGVAYMNLRQGTSSNLIAFRAYNEALALIPSEIDNNFRGRIYIYRAASLKRLGRLDEMEKDLELAQKNVSRRYEKNDLLYNYACLYALRNEREKLFTALNKMENRNYLNAIRSHMDDYFSNFQDDVEFLKLLDDKLERP